MAQSKVIFVSQENRIFIEGSFTYIPSVGDLVTIQHPDLRQDTFLVVSISHHLMMNSIGDVEQRIVVQLELPSS